MPKYPLPRSISDVSLDTKTRTALERVEALLWGMISFHGPTPSLVAAVLAALYGRPMPLEQGPEFELYFELLVLLESAPDERDATRRAILATLETATMVWEAFQDGVRAGIEQASPPSPTMPSPNPAQVQRG